MNEFENNSFESSSASVDSGKKTSEVPSDIASHGPDAIRNYLEQQTQLKDAQEKTYQGKDFSQENEDNQSEKTTESISENTQDKEFKPEDLLEKTQRIEEEIQQQNKEIASLKTSIKKLEEEISKIRAQINLPKPETEDPSVIDLKNKLTEAEEQKKSLEDEKVTNSSPDLKKTDTINKEKNEQQIEFQKILDELYTEFQTIQNHDHETWNQVLVSGTYPGGRRLVSEKFGEMDPELVVELANLFIKGLKTLNIIEQRLPSIEDKLNILLSRSETYEKNKNEKDLNNKSPQNPTNVETQ